ncbi:MAG: HigA family addiction module antitoxin [Pseudomonadota bacterium]|nr:HigA family addiction module antitoxin [Pseudomonadota bacterium]
MNKLPAIHPGEILQEEFLEPMGLSRNALAKAIGVTPARINEIANQKRGITADTAIKLGKYFNTSARFWLNLQVDYDLKQALMRVA